MWLFVLLCTILFNVTCAQLYTNIPFIKDVQNADATFLDCRFPYIDASIYNVDANGVPLIPTFDQCSDFCTSKCSTAETAADILTCLAEPSAVGCLFFVSSLGFVSDISHCTGSPDAQVELISIPKTTLRSLVTYPGNISQVRLEDPNYPAGTMPPGSSLGPAVSACRMAPELVGDPNPCNRLSDYDNGGVFGAASITSVADTQYISIGLEGAFKEYNWSGLEDSEWGDSYLILNNLRVELPVNSPVTSNKGNMTLTENTYLVYAFDPDVRSISDSSSCLRAGSAWCDWSKLVNLPEFMSAMGWNDVLSGSNGGVCGVPKYYCSKYMGEWVVSL